MLLSESEALERLSSPRNLANIFGQKKASDVIEIPIHRPGRKAGVPNLSPVERNEIAFRSKMGETQTALAQEFGTSQPHVSQIANGKDSSLDQDAISRRLSEVGDAALDKLVESLGLIDREKLKKETASGLSKIASNLSAVIERTQPKENVAQQTTVIVYTPELRKEASFKVIDV